MRNGEITKSVSKLGLKVKAHSPELLIVAGIAGVVTSAVMACKATLKVEDVLIDAKVNIDTIHNCLEDEELIENGEYTKEDGRKDLALVYFQTGVKLAKIYGPAIAVGAVSLVSIIESNRILRKRNVALAAAYTTIDKGFRDYRARVVERFGEQVDKELRYNIRAKEFEEKTVDDKGKEKVKKTVHEVSGIDNYSTYARYFDASSPYWDKDPETNLTFLKIEQNYANDMLKARGYVFLNDIYRRLGIQETKAGQVVGWIYDKDNPTGDNYIDFGLCDHYREVVRDFVNGFENVIILDFNVDGTILDKISW